MSKGRKTVRRAMRVSCPDCQHGFVVYPAWMSEESRGTGIEECKRCQGTGTVTMTAKEIEQQEKRYGIK